MSVTDPKIADMIRALRPGLTGAALTNPAAMSRDDYLALQELCERFEQDHAQGHDFLPAAGGIEEGEKAFRDVQKAVDQLMDAAPWTLHPDHGCVRTADVDLLDAGAPSERFAVKLVAPIGLVSEQRFNDAEAAMRAYSLLRHSKFGTDQGPGGYAALVDNQSQFDASYLHEGRQCYREQFAKDAGRELSAKVLRDDLTAPDRMVMAPVATLTEERLDWAAAQALGYRISDQEPAWVMGDRTYGVNGLDVTGKPLFAPTLVPSVAHRLIEDQGIGTQKVADGHWRASSQDGTVTVDGPDLATAGLRAIVAQHQWTKVPVPAALPDRLSRLEPLADSVIVAQVAAHYSDYFRGSVSCSPSLDDDGEKEASKFEIHGSGLPPHPGAMAQGSHTRWTMSDEISRSKAVEIARQYPDVRSNRQTRVSMLVGGQAWWEPMEETLKAAVTAYRDALPLDPRLTATGGSVDLKAWSELEWKVASDLVKTSGHRKDAVVAIMSYLSPTCVLPQEVENLGTWLSSELDREQAMASQRNAADSPVVAP